MSISTYAELKTAITNWSKRGDTLTVVDDFIDLAEADLWQNLRVKEMVTRATASASTSDRYLALPTGFIDMRRLDLTSGGSTYNLAQVSPEALKVIQGAGIPDSFSVGSQLTFNRIPDSSYTVEMVYYAKPTALSSSNTTNDVLTYYPTTYLYGALFHFAQWAQDDEMLVKYSSLFDEAVKRANSFTKRGVHGPAPAMRTEAPTP